MSTIHLRREPRRILIVKPSALGDIVHTLPVLHLLRRRFRAAKISWLVVPAFAGILEGHKDLDQVLLFERRRFSNMWRDASAARGLFSFAMSLRQQAFDLVIDLQGLFRSGWIAWQTRAPVRVGLAYAREGATMFYTHVVNTDTHEKHAVDRYMDVCEALGCGRGPVVFDFDLADESRDAVRQMLGGESNYAVLMPGTNWATKRWPADRFETLVGELGARYGLTSVIAGGRDVSEMNRTWTGAIDLSGKTDLKQLVALLDMSRLVVANDSGPMHIASALGRPLVTPFGPTSPVRTGPYRRAGTVIRLDIACAPCYSRHCLHHSCMQWMGVEQVLNRIDIAMK
jgi:lipopolysaccharide heptosyltransferase I